MTIFAGTTERVKVHSKSLEGALSGDSPDREVSVYLPASYQTSPNRRYPVIYFLHGFTDSDAQWFGLQKHWINLPSVLDKAFAKPGAREMIVVMPNAFTSFYGSMYSSSAVNGDWETFVTNELVAYIDSQYRTLANADSRGLAGHSMGGYGAIRLGMKNSAMFNSFYALSPCCLEPGFNPEMFTKAAGISSIDDLAKADFLTKAMLASAAAWSANPAKPPLYLDLPFENGQLRPEIRAKWEANAPMTTIHQHIVEMRKLKGIAIDAGNKDVPIAPTAKKLSEVLESYKIKHSFEIYEGDHLNHIADRIETKVIPFFSTTLR